MDTHEQPHKEPQRQPTHVLDTNVYRELITTADLWREIHRGPRLEEELIQRLFRAQSSYALLQWLHENEVATVGSGLELIAQLGKDPYCGPDLEGRTTLIETLGTSEISLFIHHLEKCCFRGWYFGQSSHPPGLEGTDVDRWLVELARNERLPLISNEGWRGNGEMNEKKEVRRLAKAAGVSVYTTKEFLIPKGVDIRQYAQRRVERTIRCCHHRRVPVDGNRMIDWRNIAEFKCPCSNRQRYGVYCHPERLPKLPKKR